jgi:ribonuclease inhibitor
MEMNTHEIILDGEFIHTPDDFHECLSRELGFGSFYGRNLNALWDRLSTDVERPIKIIWINSCESKGYLGEYFDKIVLIFEDTKKQDIKFNWDDKFEYELR